MAATLTLKRFSQTPEMLSFVYDYVGPSGTVEHGINIRPEDLVAEMGQIEMEENVFRLFCAWWSARSADFANTALVMNKNFSVDLTSPNPIRIQ
jgi:hypothetical protein